MSRHALAEQADLLEEERQLQEAIRLSMGEKEAASDSSVPDSSVPDSSVPGLIEEERQLQEAIRLSKGELGESKAISGREVPDRQRERGEKMKRKAEEELVSDRFTKHGSSKVTINYPNGGLRITRTPGRKKAKNCVNLSDVIHKHDLVSACIFSFFIADEELFPYLPLSHTSDAVPIYIGRDPNMDPMVELACNTAGMTIKGKLTKTQLESMRSNLIQLNSREYGKNFHAFYALSPGSSHSKILLLVYPDFLRIVITSCNMMDIDTVLGDNHSYIHDLPKLPSQGKDASSGFEAGLLEHLQALKTPDDFIDSIRGAYDYSTVKVHLVTSIPGTFSGPKAEKHGLLRLRYVAKSLDLRLPKKVIEGELQLEVCAASIGNLSAKWLDGFYDCALGRKNIEVAGADCAVPNLKLFYPTVGDVKSAKKSAQEAASNIGCHIRPWDKAPDEIKNIFHHYESKDKGCLFHQKLIMAYDPRESSAPPYYIYIGSANLSQSAWGALENDKKKNQATNDVKLIKLSNFECGVVIPGTLVEDLLEPGTESWREGIIPYIQDAKTYDLRKDRPWNDPRWVTGYTDGGTGF